MTRKLVDMFPAHIAVFPADLATPIGDLRSAPPSPGGYKINTGRIILTSEQILIYRDAPEGPLQVMNSPIASTSYYQNPDKSGDSYVLTRDGVRVVFRKDSNCGCGSRLRSISITNIAGSTKDPVQ
jgi:hypothetical protein